MKTTERFEKAVTKLYNAFNEGTLNALDCEHCAVGNMCDNSSNWGVYSNYSDSTNWGIETEEMKQTGYSLDNLRDIEIIFLRESINDDYAQTKESQFKGLCAVVEYLCELDGIPNVMDYTALFSNDNKLEEVFNQ